MMRKQMCVLLTIATVGACTPTQTPTQEVETKRQNLWPIAVFNYTPLDREGCQAIDDPKSYKPAQDYIDAVLDSPIDVELARESLVIAHRQLRCMSTADFIANYNLMVDHVQNEHSAHLHLMAPLLYVLAENGGRLIDDRVETLLYKASTKLLWEEQENQVIAGGVGFAYKNGTALVELNAADSLILIQSFRSWGWRVGECNYAETVFYTPPGGRVEGICINEQCPMIPAAYPGVPAGHAAFAQACKTLKEDLQNGTTLGGALVGPSNGGMSGNFPNQSSLLGDILACGVTYSTNEQYTGCVKRTAIGVKNLATLTPSAGDLQAGLKVHLFPKGCASNPYYNDGGSNAGNSGPTKREDELEVDEARRRARSAQSEKDHIEDVLAELIAAQAACANDQTQECVHRMLKAEESWELVTGETDPIQQALARAAAHTNAANANSEYEQLKTDFKVRWGHDPASAGDIDGCLATGTGCSADCAIQEQMAVDIGSCLGLGGGEMHLPTDDGVPGPDPTVAYPKPEDATPTVGFDGLTQCVANAMGINDAASNLGVGDICPHVQCANNVYAIVNSSGDCGCQAAGSASYVEAQGWGSVTWGCDNLIQCTPETQTCTCGTIGAVQGSGGFPVDPDVFLRVGYDVLVP